MKSLLSALVCISTLMLTSPLVQAGSVEIKENQLFIDGQSQPQLWGAEIQYFRLRGGQGPNIPRERVLTLWARALDAAVAAKMNTVSFYIPWDFHEYAEGKFDFDGTADTDGDGNADYPSRDVRTFIKMVLERGIRHLMARPGPYINAEWGFLGFGAIPLWFHDRFPESHARNSRLQRTTLYSYHSADFLKYTQKWLTTVHREVLAPYIGPGKPISFIQIDNETNFMWQSIYSHDYSSVAIAAYQEFLKTEYKTIDQLNRIHQREWKRWSDIKAPVSPQFNLAEDQDWYRFQDFSIATYLQKLRKIWESLGVKEPQVLFTLAESYNATENGLLPNYQWRNSKETGMMTVNLYPKTYETGDRTLMNLPFKADHDVKAADSASDFYLGRREQWLLGPEIQGGWWRGTHVSEESRRQTYLTTLGHGLKALFIYYFHEGDNWQYDWMKNSVRPFFEKLKSEKYSQVPENLLPDSFWQELDQTVANQLMVVDTRNVWRNGGTQPEHLYFDAPLGPDAQPRRPYEFVKELGQKIMEPYGEFLGRAQALEDPVCVIKDSNAHAPSPISGVNSRLVQSDWNAGLLALLMHAGVNARIHHWGLNPTSDLLDFSNCQLIIYQDTGFASAELVATLSQALEQGAFVLSFLHTGLTNSLIGMKPQSSCSRLIPSPMEVHGFRCEVANGILFHAKVPIYDVFNTDFYSMIHDARDRSAFIEKILTELRLRPHIRINGGGDRTVAFGRTDANHEKTWITLKTARRDGFAGRVQWTGADVTRSYRVTDPLGMTSFDIMGSDLITLGFPARLPDSGSTAYLITPLPPLHPNTSFTEWLEVQKTVSISRMLQNISPRGAASGIVIASPSQDSPNYYFHWTRDASLVMKTVVDLWQNSQGSEQNEFLNALKDFVTLSRRQQLAPAAEGLGEPRYLVDGSPDTIDWARPQYDGPALRALTLLRFLQAVGQIEVLRPLSDQEASIRQLAKDVVLTDLEFVMQTWRKRSFDIWEELRGLHFYTQAAQHTALALAAKVLAGQVDPAFLARLSTEAELSRYDLSTFWDPRRGYVLASQKLEGRPGLPNYKNDNLDTSVILAVLHSENSDGFLSLSNDQLLATARALEVTFAREYPINHRAMQLAQDGIESAIAIGRFSDDIYFGGNPWYLTTAAFAEFHYRVARTIIENQGFKVTSQNRSFFDSALAKKDRQRLKVGQQINSSSRLGQKVIRGLAQKGDGYLGVLRKFTGPRGEMSEQFDRKNGRPTSANDLTWSYKSFLSAYHERARLPRFAFAP